MKSQLRSGASSAAVTTDVEAMCSTRWLTSHLRRVSGADDGPFGG